MSTTGLHFHPWIGQDYARLSQQTEAKVLLPDVWAHPFHVLGESHYGKPDEAIPNLTRSIVESCGFASNFGKCSAFFAKILKVIHAEEHPEIDRKGHWQKLAFSNYIQEVLTGPGVPPTDQQWDGGRHAFREQLKATTPQVLLVLGQRLWNHLPRDFGFPVSELQAVDSAVTVKETWAYVYEAHGIKHLTLAVYVIHPSAGGGAFKWRIAAERARTVALYHSNLGCSPEYDECDALRLD